MILGSKASLRCQGGGHGVTPCRAGGVGWRREQGTVAAGSWKAPARLRRLAEEEEAGSRAGRQRWWEKGKPLAVGERECADGGREQRRRRRLPRRLWWFGGLWRLCGPFFKHGSSFPSIQPRTSTAPQFLMSIFLYLRCRLALCLTA
jgi:hypothetical protein